MRKTEIPLSKTKTIIMLIGSLVFVFLGISFTAFPAWFTNYNYQFDELAVIIGIASIVFFGICSLFITRKLFDNRPGIIIDDSGIFDNTSGIGGGQILWIEIKKISVVSIRNHRIISILLYDPQGFIERQTNLYKKQIMKMNFSLGFSPANINTGALKISFDELYKLITEGFEQQKPKS